MRKAIVLILLLALAACTPPAPTAAPTSVPAATAVPATTSAPTKVATAAATAIPPPAPTATATAKPTVPAATATAKPTAKPTATVDPYAGWSTYTNGKYSFSLRYPTGWALKEEPSDGRVSDVVKLTRQTFTLILGFKRTNENLIIEAGMPAGDLEVRGTLVMLGVSVPKKVLVFQGKDKAVYYNSTTPVQAGSLQMLAGVQDFVTNYAAVSLPQDVQAAADLIVRSIKLN